MSPPADPERGVALVAAAVALALLSAFATSLAWTSTVDQRLAHNALAALQADALARSGVAAATVLLRDTAAADAPDTLRAPWAHASGAQPLGAGTIAVTIEDEARRLDLNAFPGAFARLLATLDLDTRLADTLADWTDADDTPRAAGAERDWYQALPAPYTPRNAPLRTTAELALIRGFTPTTLERLRPFVTTAGEPAVNPNTAPPEILLALGADPATIDRLLTTRAERPLTRPDFHTLLPTIPESTLTERSTTYTIHVTATVGEIQRTIEATISAPPGTNPTITAWHPLPPP